MEVNFLSQDYLLKTEPSEYSFADLQRDAATEWEGVSNPAAVKNLREMISGARLIIYETGARKSAVGTGNSRFRGRFRSQESCKGQNQIGKGSRKNRAVTRRNQGKQNFQGFAARAHGQALRCATHEGAVRGSGRHLKYSGFFRSEKIKTKQAEACSTQGHRAYPGLSAIATDSRQPARRESVYGARATPRSADDGGDQSRWRDVECRIRGGYIRSDAHSAQMRHLFGGTLFNGNLFSS